MITVLLGVLAALQTAWFLVYVTGPWRDTRLGWVWLLKGSLLAIMWWLLFVNQHHDVPDLAWKALAVAMVVATAAWLVATIRVRLGANMVRRR